jgi:hypothetical protein
MLDDAGTLVYTSGDTLYFARDNGMVSVSFADRIVRRRYVAKFGSDPKSWWITDDGIIAAISDQHRLYIANARDGNVQQYRVAGCLGIAGGVYAAFGQVVISCTDDNAMPSELLVLQSP